MKLWEEIEAAQKKIQKVIPRTPVIYSDTFSKLTGKEVFLKLENLQKTGSFKIRGAYYKLSQLTPSMEKTTEPLSRDHLKVAVPRSPPACISAR